MRRLVLALIGAALFGIAVFYGLTIPRGLSAKEVAALPEGDPVRGETWFWAGGCASCHSAEGAKGEERLKLGGGRVLTTEFGNFVVPNISSDPADGIGDWSNGDLANAMLRGVSPSGTHYYPAFPYASYTRMNPEDIADLRAYMRTLPAIAGTPPPNDLRFPFNFRRGIGLWKRAFLSDAPAVDLPDAGPEVLRGQYLAEGAGHCGECHTPRNFAGALDTSRWLAGAQAAEGSGRVPNITPGAGGIGDWPQSDIAYYFETGFTPEFDAVGGSMVEVQENLAMLKASDRTAIAAYLQAIPPRNAAQ